VTFRKNSGEEPKKPGDFAVGERVYFNDFTTHHGSRGTVRRGPLERGSDHLGNRYYIVEPDDTHHADVYVEHTHFEKLSAVDLLSELA